MVPSRGASPGRKIQTAVDSSAVFVADADAGHDEKRDGANLADGRARDGAVTCEDCFFKRRGLCALGLDSPCPTFRPDTPEGLVPPRQPALLMRDRPGETTAQVVVQAA
jgi:hypothetical protein